MKKSIFYSWQSDLPNRTNRSFIEECLQKSIKKIKNQDEYFVEFNIDRDTQGEAGTPDIVSTIFSKISQSDIFVADVSIINSHYEGKKTPNPNVLIELGYAARTLGWDNIICILNAHYGDVELLPFDLRFRRPIIYRYSEMDTDKPKEQLVNDLTKAIIRIQGNNSVSNEIFEYLKVQIDDELLFTLSYLTHLIFEYDYLKEPLEAYKYLLNLGKEELSGHIKSRLYYGFQLYKNWGSREKKFVALLEKPMITNNLDAIKTVPIINIIKAMRALNDLQRYDEIYNITQEKNENYTIVSGYKMNKENGRESYLLLEKVDADSGRVTDSGDFQKYKVSKLLKVYQIDEAYLGVYVSCIFELISAINKWIELTGDEILFSPNMFKMRPKPTQSGVDFQGPNLNE